MKRAIRPLSAISGASGAEHALKDRGVDLKNTANQIDKIVSDVFSRNELSSDQKHITTHQNIQKGISKFISQLDAARDHENLMITAHTAQLKSNQLREKPWTDRQSAMLPFILEDLKDPTTNLIGKSDSYLQVAAALDDDSLVHGKVEELDNTFSRDVLDYISKSNENIKFIDTMLSRTDEYLSYDLSVGELPDMMARAEIATFQD